MFWLFTFFSSESLWNKYTAVPTISLLFNYELNNELLQLLDTKSQVFYK